MEASQFKIFTSSDLGAPYLNGLTGSLINVLTWCLVSGSGWLQPSASAYFSSSVPNIGIYQQPSGSKCILYVNDTGPNVTPVGQEAWVTGWENLTTMSAPCGTGSNQFPMFGQLLVNGHYVVRKSSTATFVQRQWVMFSDPYTFYFFIKNNDTSEIYTSLFFGDIFSFRGSSDNIKCILSSKTFENNSAGTIYDLNDTIMMPVLPTIYDPTAGPNTIMSRNIGGRYTCPFVGKVGAWDFALSSYANTNYTPMVGVLPTPNPTDGTIYIRPIMIWEPGNGLRGRMRGMYHVPCSIIFFPDGSIFGGTGEFAGKIFQVVSKGYNGGFWVIEISNTLETN